MPNQHKENWDWAKKNRGGRSQTHLSGHGRRENDAEHAWHMAIMAYLLREYPMLPPVTAVIAVIEQQGLKVIHGMGKPGLRRLPGLKFVKERHQLRRLVSGQHGVQLPLGRLLPLLLGADICRRRLCYHKPWTSKCRICGYSRPFYNNML